jgi:hypothetical protein
MPLTKQLISEIAADMAAEQAYYKRLHTLIECAKHTGAPIPQVRPFPGRFAAAGAHGGGEAVTSASVGAVFNGRSGTLAGPHPWAAGAARRRGVRSHLRSFGQAVARFLSPVKNNGPVL